MLFDVAGTAAVLAGCTASFVADEKQHALLTMRSVIPGLWHPLAYIAGGGLALGTLGIGVAIYMAMRVLGIGPVGTLVASGVLEEHPRVILADFTDRSGDSTLAAAVTEAFRVDLGESKSLTLVQAGALDEAFRRMQRDRPRSL